MRAASTQSTFPLKAPKKTWNLYWRCCRRKMCIRDSLESLRPRFLLEPERLIPIPRHKKLRKELREALLWQGYEENYDSAIRAVFVEGAGWLSP